MFRGRPTLGTDILFVLELHMSRETKEISAVLIKWRDEFFYSGAVTFQPAEVRPRAE
jgi:hypothetical protein